MNRPVAGPCWVVWRWAGETAVRPLYLGVPRVDEYLDGIGFPTFFGIGHVEPFLSEVDAIAAAVLLTEGEQSWFVDRVDHPGTTRTRVR